MRICLFVMVSQNLKNELKDIVKEDYGIVLSPNEIEQIANNLVSYFDLLKKIYHRGQCITENKEKSFEKNYGK